MLFKTVVRAKPPQDWNGHLFWVPGGKTHGGDVGLPVETMKKYYPNPWDVPLNAFAMQDGKRLSFQQLLKMYK